MQTIETYLPVFTGFYGTIFEADEEQEIYNINEVRNQKGLPDVDYDKIDFDYSGYYKEKAEYCCHWVEQEMRSLGFDCTIEFEQVNSPREYNFSNDSIHCKVSIDIDNLIDYATKNWLEFSEYIKENYSSYDGFISFRSSDAQTWLNEIINKEEHSVGSLMHFILNNEIEDAQWEMYHHGIGDMHGLVATNYDELTEGGVSC